MDLMMDRGYQQTAQVFRSRLPPAECLRLPPRAVGLPQGLRGGLRGDGGAALRAVPLGRSAGLGAQPQQL